MAEALQQVRGINLIYVMSLNGSLHSVFFHDLDTFNTWNARTRSIALPSMSKPFLLSAHSLLSTCFLLSAYFLAVHSYKRMRLTTSVYSNRDAVYDQKISSHTALEPSKGHLLPCFCLWWTNNRSLLEIMVTLTHLIALAHVCSYCLRAATISFAELQVRLLFEDSYYWGCCFVSNKYSNYNFWVINQCRRLPCPLCNL